MYFLPILYANYVNRSCLFVQSYFFLLPPIDDVPLVVPRGYKQWVWLIFATRPYLLLVVPRHYKQRWVI